VADLSVRTTDPARPEETTVADHDRRTEDEGQEHFDVSELASPTAGSSSPFGDVEFPLPVEATGYTHPGARERPHLAGA
jgi:hypothetical protein